MKKIIIVFTLCLLVFQLSSFVNKKEQPKTIATLGQLLFFDSILSRNYSLSCATCHKPEFAFADTVTITPGVFKRLGTRNTPSAMNLRFQVSFFWDGRAKTLEEQALIPIENPLEMDMPINMAVERLNRSDFYVAAFLNLFHERPTPANLATSLAEFERTLETSESAFDNWRINDDETGITASVKRGFELFNSKGKCIQCHFGPDFNNPEFRNIGLFDGKKFNDSGRAAISHQAGDLGKFKIAPLRNIAITAPYMHNGMFKTLAEVINFYNDPEIVVPGNYNRDSLLLKPLGLTIQDKSDIEAFLRTLTDKRFTGLTVPRTLQMPYQ